MKKSEVIVKTDLASNWAKAVNYIPEPGTIIIYEIEGKMPKIKIGDGKTFVEQLPFLSTSSPSVDNDVLDLEGGF